MDIMSLTAVELGKKIKAKEISVTEATQAYLDQIEKVENDVHSYVTIDKEGALKRAEEVQKMIDDGTLLSPLAGVRWQSRIICARKGREQLAVPKFWKILFQPLLQRQF